jgi:hypothetical protein
LGLAKLYDDLGACLPHPQDGTDVISSPTTSKNLCILAYILPSYFISGALTIISVKELPKMRAIKKQRKYLCSISQHIRLKTDQTQSKPDGSAGFLNLYGCWYSSTGQAFDKWW